MSFFPLRTAWGLPERQLMTCRARDACLRLCVGSSYAGVSRGLERLWGSAPCAETLRQAALVEGERLRREKAQQARQVLEGEVAEPREAPRRMYVTLDGGWARGRERGEWHEAKLSAVYSDRRVRVSKDRYRLLGRRNVGTFGCSEQLGELVYAEAFAQGVEAAPQVVVLGDGASWIRTIKEHHFPQAELRLDAFHVLQALDRGLRAAYPDDKAKRWEKKRQLKDLIWEGKVVEALRRLRLIAHHVPEASGLQETIGYFSSQAAYMPAYGRLQQRGEMISSSLAEEAVDRVFNDRFKHRHRHWRPDSADALLQLRLLDDRGEWDQHWTSTKRAA
jgi:hypothetical protein